MIYKNPSKPGRSKDLLSRMTLDEKIAQMTCASLLDVMTDRHTLTFRGKARPTFPMVAVISTVLAGRQSLNLRRWLLSSTGSKNIWWRRHGWEFCLFVTEATSGVLSRDHTLFPQNIGAAAMFNEEPVQQMEMRCEKKCFQRANGLHWLPWWM